VIQMFNSSLYHTFSVFAFSCIMLGLEDSTSDQTCPAVETSES